MNRILRFRPALSVALVLALASVTASSCGADSASSQAPITDGDLCQFHLGTTSIEDVTKLLGPASRSGTTGPFYYLLYEYPAPDGTPIALSLAFQGGYLEQVSRQTGAAPQVDGLPSCNGASTLGGAS